MIKNQNAQPLLVVRDLQIGYHHQPLFKPMSWSVEPGIVVAMIGRNGIGKSTLLASLLGLIPKIAGSINTKGVIGFVPQHFVTDLSLSAKEVVLLGRAIHIGLFTQPKKEDEEVALSKLAQLNALDLAQKTFSAMSGGQQQLVMIARALATGAELIALDEPMSALDLNAQERVLKLILQLKREGKSVIFTTHDPMHAALVADKVLRLTANHVWSYGDVEEELTEAKLLDTYGVNVEMVASAGDKPLPLPRLNVHA